MTVAAVTPQITMAAEPRTTVRRELAREQADTVAVRRLAVVTNKATMGAAGTVMTTPQLMDTAQAAA